MQKYFVENHISKTLRKNDGELPQYYIKNHHEPIIEECLWDAVQIQLQRRKGTAKPCDKEGFFRGLIFCTACSEKCMMCCFKLVTHRKEKYRSVCYCVNIKYLKKCNSPVLREGLYILAVVEAIKLAIISGIIDETDLNYYRSIELIGYENDEIVYITTFFVYKMIDKILILPNDELEIIFYNETSVKIDYEKLKDRSRIKEAYKYMKIMTYEYKNNFEIEGCKLVKKRKIIDEDFKENRIADIYLVLDEKNNCIPEIRLSGDWLDDFGFKIGSQINVKCEKGKITITPKE